MSEALLDSTAKDRGLFEGSVVARLIHEHISGRKDHKERLWALLCFELWARDYLDKSPFEH